MKKMRMKKLIVGNWKMNPNDPARAKEIVSGIKKGVKKFSRAQVVLCPPFVYLSDVVKWTANSNVSVGVQNVFSEAEGSYTGEVSAVMSKKMGAAYSIIGHSERRKLGETDESVAKKLRQALAAGLFVIVCIGEHERDGQGSYLGFIEKQLKASLAGIEKGDLKRLIIAYEPVWAIGKTDKEAMQPAQIYETSIFIRKILSDLYGAPLIAKLPVLYGGSVSSQIAQAILSEGEVDGLLVGRQSLNAQDFCQIIAIANEL